MKYLILLLAFFIPQIVSAEVVPWPSVPGATQYILEWMANPNNGNWVSIGSMGVCNPCSFDFPAPYPQMTWYGIEAKDANGKTLQIFIWVRNAGAPVTFLP
jgi:hypothetical protein